MRNRKYLILDLSNNNHVTDIRAIKNAGVDACWHKVSEGRTFTDKDWHKRSALIREHGMRVGGYHFAQPNLETAKAEAAHFLEILGDIKRRDFCPGLDAEVNPHNLGPRQLIHWYREFNRIVHKESGVWPIFYSFPSFIDGLHAEAVIGRGLWLASFGRNDGAEHPFRVPRPFKKALAHQFTSQARIPGVSGHVDLSSARRIVPLLARGYRGL